jgi:hypothetical protein
MSLAGETCVASQQAIDRVSSGPAKAARVNDGLRGAALPHGRRTKKPLAGMATRQGSILSIRWLLEALAKPAGFGSRPMHSSDLFTPTATMKIAGMA